MGKQGLEAITDRSIMRASQAIKQGSNQGTIPTVTEATFYQGYKINIDGNVIGKNGTVMKYIFKPRSKTPYIKICICKRSSDGRKTKSYKEYSVTKLMKKKFGTHIAGYGDTQSHANKGKKFMIVPKDNDRSNVSLANLVYVDKSDFLFGKSAKNRISLLLRISNLQVSDADLAKQCGVKVSWVNQQRTSLKNNGFGDPEIVKLGIKITLETEPIYKALLLCNGQKSNLVLAREIWPQENFSDKINQDRLVDKIVRVRKRLADKGIIQRYNTYGKETNIAAVKESLVFALEDNLKLPKQQRRTHAEIAIVLGLDKSQVDNFSRSLKRRSGTEELQVS